MAIILWDASGLVKRYFRETGSDTVDAIFQTPVIGQHSVTLWGYAECVSILHRKRNKKLLSVAAYGAAVSALQQEVLASSRFKVLTIEDDRILVGLVLLVKHNLNSSDAAILATYLRFRDSLPAGSPACHLVAADKRLLRAAEAEGLRTLNPELLSAADVTERMEEGAV